MYLQSFSITAASVRGVHNTKLPTFCTGMERQADFSIHIPEKTFILQGHEKISVLDI